MDRVIQSLEQRVPVASQYGDLSPQKKHLIKKEKRQVGINFFFKDRINPT